MIYHMGEWKYFGRRRWDIEDATVACRQLGYSKAVSNVVARGLDDSSYLEVRMDYVRCRGNEINLRHCLFEDEGYQRVVRAYEVAGATCGKIM